MEGVKAWLEGLDSALQRGDIDAASELFDESECFWRDLIAFTWNLYTAESRDEVKAMLEATLDQAKPCGWTVDKELPPENRTEGIDEAFIKFETRTGRCKGHVRLKGGKCWTLLTTMEELTGHEEKAGPRRENGVQHGAVRGRKTWLDERKEEMEELGKSKQPYCVIVGGGQAGIILGARLRRLGVPTIILEKNARPGDSWRNRYKSLCLHDSVWYDHLPYLPFPDHWPVFSPKDRIGDWLEAYSEVMELVYWSSCECRSASFDAEKGNWEVEVVKRGGSDDHEAEIIRLRPQELVLATGMSGFPHVPTVPGADTFRGAQCHSSQYKGAEGWAGKHCVVVGSNTSAHDICADLWEQGAAGVTMVQRSPSHVVRSETLLSTSNLYCEGSPFSTEDADRLFAATPYKIFHRFQIPLYDRARELDADFYRRLTDAGFLLEFGEDGSGLFMKYLRRGSGYYIDVGASELIVRGDVELRSGVGLREMTEDGVVLSDGSRLPADLVVFATGYGSMNAWAAQLISPEVADKVGKCWGLGSATAKDPGPWERELRNMWKPTQQPGLWFQGGNLHQCRHYSLFLALQIKARLEGIPTPVYGLPRVHHTS